jgi:hypothetical protein
MAVEVLAGYWDLNLETRELLLCPRSQKMFGLVGSRRRPLPSYDWQPRIHPDDLLTIDGELEAAGRNDKTYCARFRTVRPDGSTCEVLGVGRATASDPKRFIGLNFDLHDATAMAQRESRNARSRMSLASTRLLGAGPANENDIRAWRVWSPHSRKSIEREGGLETPRAANLGPPGEGLNCTTPGAETVFESGNVRRTSFRDTARLVRAPFAQHRAPGCTQQCCGGASVRCSRWLQFLVNEGLVLTVNATDDPCETTAALTDKGRIALNEYFRAAGRVV